MGGSSSREVKTESEMLTEFLSQSLIKTLQKCQKQVENIQEVDVTGGDVSDVTLSQTINFDTVCQQDSSSIKNVQNKIYNDLKQKADEHTDSLGSFLNKLVPSTTDNVRVIDKLKMKQRIEEIFSVETVMEMNTKIVNRQSLNVSGGRVRKLKMIQGINVVEKALQTNSAMIKLKNDVDNIAKQVAGSTSEGIFTFMTSPAGIIILVAVVVVIGPLLFK